MLISIKTRLVYAAPAPCDLLLQIEAVQDATQNCLETHITFQPDIATHAIQGEDNVGRRRWVYVDQTFDCSYRTQIRVERPYVAMRKYDATPLPRIPNDVIKYLMPSRYCHPEDFFAFVADQFGSRSGGDLVMAMSDWIFTQFTYDNGVSHASTSATDSFKARAGVCRDYAHVLITMARAVGIPARFVSAYAPDVTPQDFHAVVEVYLEGHWHLIDPTGMARTPEIVRIGVGRDAADASFMTSYGLMTLIQQSVDVSRVD